MNFEQFEYTIAGFRALEVYPFTKRYCQLYVGPNATSVAIGRIPQIRFIVSSSTLIILSTSKL